MRSAMNRTDLLASIRETHAPIESAVAAMDDEMLLGPAPGMDGWTRKDVLAHIAWWNDHSARVVEGLRAGREPYDRSGPFEVDALNARTLEENRDRSAADVRRRESETFVRLVGLVEATSEDELFEIGRYPWLGADSALYETVVADSSEHYPEHLPHLSGGGAS
jgi:hypothetical protein